MRSVGIIESAIVSRPIFVPGARTIRYRVISSRLLADPKNRRDDFFFPWISVGMLGWIMSGRREISHGVDHRKRIILQSIRFLAYLHLHCWHFGGGGVSEERCDRGNDDRDRVRERARLHRSKISPAHAPEPVGFLFHKNRSRCVERV